MLTLQSGTNKFSEIVTETPDSVQVEFSAVDGGAMDQVLVRQVTGANPSASFAYKGNGLGLATVLSELQPFSLASDSSALLANLLLQAQLFASAYPTAETVVSESFGPNAISLDVSERLGNNAFAFNLTEGQLETVASISVVLNGSPSHSQIVDQDGLLQTTNQGYIIAMTWTIKNGVPIAPGSITVQGALRAHVDPTTVVKLANGTVESFTWLVHEYVTIGYVKVKETVQGGHATTIIVESVGV